MRSDKAFLDVGGRPMVMVSVEALTGAGATEVVVIGGDAPRLTQLGLGVVPDLASEGPLPALALALASATTDVVVVLACDLPDVTPAAVTAVLVGLEPGAEASIAVTDTQLHPLLAAYRVSCLPTLEAEIENGTRAVVHALRSLEFSTVELDDPRWATNLNDPAALDDWRCRHRA